MKIVSCDEYEMDESVHCDKKYNSIASEKQTQPTNQISIVYYHQILLVGNIDTNFIRILDIEINSDDEDESKPNTSVKICTSAINSKSLNGPTLHSSNVYTIFFFLNIQC